MIAFLRGTILSRTPEGLVLDVNGVGYRLRVPTSTTEMLGDVGDPAELHTHLHVREDDMSLYGFATSDELEMFELLLGVSGIGPKVALGMLSAASPDVLRSAIAQGNLEVLTRIPGIGKKTAQRLLLELKGKLELEEEFSELSIVDQEVTATLINLGWSAAEAQRAARAVAPSGKSLEERIRAALQLLGS